MKTLVMTNREIDPLWQDWSKAVAYAESLPVGSDEEQAAWRRADEMWERFVDARHEAQLAETHQCRCALEEADDPLTAASIAIGQADAAYIEAQILADYDATVSDASYWSQ